MNANPSLVMLSLAFLAPASPAQVLVDWDFGSLVNPGVPNGPIADPLLDGSLAGASLAVVSSGLRGERVDPTYEGLRWTSTNPDPGELNLRYFDGDPTDPNGTNNDGVSDNYLSFTLMPTGASVEVTRISISLWRNGSGAPGTYAMEVVADGNPPTSFGAAQLDPTSGDFGFDWFQFDDQVTATNTLEIRFRPVASAGGQGTGNLHINGLRVETGTQAVNPPTGPNVLFLIADDLTADALGCYGNSDVLTPNIDALADRGMLFERSYCQYPVCNASRASMLTGWYTSRIEAAGGDFNQFDAALGDHNTLPEYFRLSGYTSARVSKLYHMRIPGDITSGAAGPDHAPSWDMTFNALAPEWMTTGMAAHYTNESLNFDPNLHYGLGFGAAFYTVESNTDGSEQADAISAAQAMQLLGSLQDDPFFLAVGFVRPHVPLVAPASAYALYDAAQLPLAESVPNDLQDIPSQGVFWNEPVRGPFNDSARKEVLRAYYASVTFMDEQVGKVLDRLTELGLEDDTIIVFTSDHGYHLGEHSMWQKLSLHEESARVPLIIAGPGLATGRTGALAELVDLYPTLADLAGLEVPPLCQGLSLRSILDSSEVSVREAALCRVSNGDLLRTEDWAYMRYSNGGEELYDMSATPPGDPLQFTNLANSPAHSATLAQLRTLLDAKLLAAAADPGQAFCFGDATGPTICPCLAFGDLGEGCMNSSGSGARLSAGGSADLISDGFTLQVSGAPANQAGVLFHGTTQNSVPLADGILCTVPVQRYPLHVLDETGGTSYSHLGAQATSGTTNYYQYYFRDTAGACGGGFNFTNGWQVIWH